MSMSVILTETEPARLLTTKSMPGREADREADRDCFSVVFKDCSTGLGIKIIGGLGEEEGDQDYGIFIRKVLPGGLAHQQGQLQEGDQLIAVNDEDLGNVTNDEAVHLLRDASAANYVKLDISRDDIAKDEYDDLLQAYTYSSASSMCDRQSMSSRGSLLSPRGTETHTDGWTSPLSAAYPCGPGTRISAAVRSQRQRCEGSSSGSEHDGKTDASPLPHGLFQSQGPLPRYSMPHPLLGPSPLSDFHHSLTQPKIPNEAAASMQHRGLGLAPTMSSTPHEAQTGYRANSSPPGGASGLSPEYTTYQPSPVISPEASQLHTLPGASAHGYSATASDSEVNKRSEVNGRSRSLRDHHTRRLSLDPQVRLKVEKLEMALTYLGIDPKPEQRKEMLNRLEVDEDRMVTYKQFVDVAKEIFKFQLEDKHFSAGAMAFAMNDIKDFTNPPAFNPQLTHLSEMGAAAEAEELKKENESLRHEVRELKKLLRKKEGEMMKVRQDAHGALYESHSLRSKVHLAEQAQRAARTTEHDYEEVIRLLEAEVVELRKHNAQEVVQPAIQQRLAVLGCQVRKAEVTKKTYEVATEKLLQFAEHVYETSMAQGDTMSRPVSAVSHGELARGSQPPGYPQKKSPGKSLATEARDVVKAVKSLIEVEPLPFGWEEAYTADGMKYYINHVTQMTTWQHPVSNVQHEPSGSRPSTAGNPRAKGRQPLNGTGQLRKGKQPPNPYQPPAGQNRTNSARSRDMT